MTPLVNRVLLRCPGVQVKLNSLHFYEYIALKLRVQKYSVSKNTEMIGAKKTDPIMHLYQSNDIYGSICELELVVSVVGAIKWWQLTS